MSRAVADLDDEPLLEVDPPSLARPLPPLRAVPSLVGVGWPPGDATGGQDRARLRRARDMLIDIEDELLYVVPRDRSLQPMVDSVVALLMDLTHRVE